MFSLKKKNNPLVLCWSFYNFVSEMSGVILTPGKQTPKGYFSEETRIMPVVKSVQE